MIALAAIVAVVSNASFVQIASPVARDTVYTSAPTFRGVSRPGAEIVVQVDGAPRAYARADEEGHWEAAVPFSEPLAEGLHTVRALAPDALSEVVSFSARRVADSASLGRMLGLSLLTVAFGLWCVLRRRDAQELPARTRPAGR